MRNNLQLHGLISKGAQKVCKAPAHQIVPMATFDALVSPYALAAASDNASPDILGSAAMMHHRILLAYCADNAVLPMRFGTVFSSQSTLMAAMLEKADAYNDALKLLSKQREFSVQLNISQGDPEPPSPKENGRAFLSQRQSMRDRRRNQTQHRRAFAQWLCAQLTALSTYPVTSATAKPDRVLDVSVLIPVSRIHELRALASAAYPQAVDLALSLSITGPWPAYNFDTTHMDQSEVSNVS